MVIVTGAPASGKSTIARQLATRLGMPLFSKDLFKETLFDELGWSDRQWSQRLGGASMALLFRSAAAVLEAGHSVMIESNFYPELSLPPLRQLADRFACRFLQVVCTASTSSLLERYERRITTGERHPGHTESESLDEVLSRIVNGRWDALDLDGPVITVDTDQNEMPDIDALAATVLAVLR